MLSVKNSYHYEETIKYSRFVSIIFRVDTKEEINNYIEKVKKEYPNASHYCYGYVLDNEVKASDDGEPAKTAGMPILNHIMGQNLNHTLIIVVRYFGGIKLGTGLLTRTYAKMARNVIEKENIVSLEKGYLVTIEFRYDVIKNVDYLLKDSKIIAKKFDDVITYEVIIKAELLSKLEEYVIKKEDTYVEKY